MPDVVHMNAGDEPLYAWETYAAYIRERTAAIEAERDRNANWYKQLAAVGETARQRGFTWLGELWDAVYGDDMRIDLKAFRHAELMNTPVNDIRKSLGRLPIPGGHLTPSERIAIRDGHPATLPA